MTWVAALLTLTLLQPPVEPARQPASLNAGVLPANLAAPAAPPGSAAVAPAPAPAAKPPADGPSLAAFKLRSLGPALMSGRVVGIAVPPQEPNTYYLAVASGGVWKTTNRGTTWEPIFDGESSYSVGCVVVDPKNPKTVWVGTGENNSQRSVGYGDGVYKSTDGGRSWKNVGLKSCEHVGKIVVDPKDSDTVYVAAQGPLWNSGGERGLYKTADGGKTWSRILHVNDDTGVTDVLVDPRNPDKLLAASYQRRRHVYTLVNGGPGSALHRSTDGGKTWAKVAAGVPAGDLGRVGLAMAPSDPDTVYASIEANDKAGGVFRSTDGGATWEKRNPFESQGQYYAHLVADPHNKDRVYVMNVYVQVSDDGGRTLNPLNSDHKHVDNHTIWIDPADREHQLVGCDGGLYETHDRGRHWRYHANLPVTQFYDVGVDQNPASGRYYHVYGGTQDNSTLGGPVRSRNGHGVTSADWYIVQGGDGFHCTVDPTDSNTVYGEYQYGGLCRFDRKTGYRVDIRPLPAPGEAPLRWNWDSPLIISPHAPKRLYYAANRLFKSDDRGDSWTPASPDLTRQLDRDALPVFGQIQRPEAVAKHLSTSFYGNIVALAESPKAEGRLYAGTDDGLIQTTTDGGKTWTCRETFPGVPNRSYVSKLAASQHREEVVYAAFDNHKNGDFKPYLLKSADGGATWASLAGTLPERGTVYAFAEDHRDPNLLFCGTEFGLYASRDGGASWKKLTGGLPTVCVKDLVIQRANNDLIVGTFGRGIYVLDDYSTLRELTPEKLDEAAHLFATPDAPLFLPAAPLGDTNRGTQGASYYAAANPAHGVTFTYHLKGSPKTLKQRRFEAEKAAKDAKQPVPYPTAEQLRAEAEEEPAAVQLTITDREGEIVRVLAVPGGEGLHRVTWDFHRTGVFGEGGGGLAMPGDYFAVLSRRAAGQSAQLTRPATFHVTPDPLAGLSATDYEEMALFQKQSRALQKRLRTTGAALTEAAGKLDKLRDGFAAAPKSDEPSRRRVREASQELRSVRRALYGDELLAARNENAPLSIASRVYYVAGATEESLSRPTGTQKQALAQAQTLLAAEVERLRPVVEATLPELEKALEAAGGQPLPGRLPGKSE